MKLTLIELGEREMALALLAVQFRPQSSRRCAAKRRICDGGNIDVVGAGGDARLRANAGSRNRQTGLRTPDRGCFSPLMLLEQGEDQGMLRKRFAFSSS